MDFLKHTTQSVPPAVTKAGQGSSDGYGMDCAKTADASQMNAKGMITKEFIQQVPSAGTPAGKSGTGKDINSMPTTEVSAHGVFAGK